jgi:hypothetical protein
MWFAYIDESKDPGRFYVYTALIMNADGWRGAFEKVKSFRRQLRDEHGIYLLKELHAWKFAGGKGRPAKGTIGKLERSVVFRKVLRFIASSNTFVVASSCNTNQQYAFERLINRLNRTARGLNQNVVLFFDEGEERNIVSSVRRMKVFNHIPSNRGVWWDTGATTKNITLDNIVEDPIFKDSEQSYFIQLADFCAYALLRMERPIASRTKYGYDTMYRELARCSRRRHNLNDPRGMGIIR